MHEAYGSCDPKLHNIVPAAAVFLDIEKGFDKIWHLVFLYKLSKV